MDGRAAWMDDRTILPSWQTLAQTGEDVAAGEDPVVVQGSRALHLRYPVRRGADPR